jgi:hypothetical protein
MLKELDALTEQVIACVSAIDAVVTVCVDLLTEILVSLD